MCSVTWLCGLGRLVGVLGFLAKILVGYVGRLASLAKLATFGLALASLGGWLLFGLAFWGWLASLATFGLAGRLVGFRNGQV
jgi:hypothetical protein